MSQATPLQEPNPLRLPAAAAEEAARHQDGAAANGDSSQPTTAPLEQSPIAPPAAGNSSLIFRRLAISRMAGFESGGFEIPELSSGVNVIFGPNGCGKTQTARAIAAVLWRDEALSARKHKGQPRSNLRGAAISASLELITPMNLSAPAEAWSVNLDAGDYRYQRGGVDSPPPDLPPAENRERYTLPLHELLQSDETGLAETVLRESAGGYDLSRALEALEFRANPQRGNSEAKALKEAIERVHIAEAEQEDLRDQERQLAELQNQQRSLEGDRMRIEMLDKAIDRARAADQFADAARLLDTFPAAMKKLSGSDVRLAADLKEKLGKHLQSRAAAEENFAAAARDMAACALPSKEAAQAAVQDTAQEAAQDGAPASQPPVAIDTALAELADRAQRLEKKDADLRKQIADVESLKVARDKARTRIGSAITNQQLASLGGVGIGEVANLTRRAEKWRADKAAVRALEEWLGPAEAREDVDRLQQGVLHLSHWLRMAEPPETAGMGPIAPPASTGRRVAKIITGILAGALILGLGALLMLTGKMQMALLAIPAILLLLVFAWLARAPRPTAEKRRVMEAAADGALALAAVAARRQVPLEEYMRLGLESPAEWIPSEVESLWKNLSQRLARARISAERMMRWADLASRRQQLEFEQAQLLADYEAMRGRLGLQLRIDEASLSLLADNISRWQEADQQVAAASAIEGQLEFELHQLLSAANKTLESFKLKADDPSQLRGIVDSLRARLSDHQEAASRHEGCARNIRLFDAEIADLTARQAALFANLGLAENDVITLDQWERRLPEFRDAMRRMNIAESDLRRTEAALTEVSQRAAAASVRLEAGHEEERPSARTMLLPQLEEERFELQNRLRTQETVREEIVRIEDRLDKAKKSRGLEEALGERDARRDALRRQREADGDSAIGFLLAEHLRQETRDRSRPAVFRRARTLFARITQGRYTLEFDEGAQDGQPSFRAIDRDTGAGLSLDELSSGSRLQLLLSVRVAFVEEQERGLKLPLIFDETLGNSDEQRARAIIEATIELARGGRQIFYFTAQPDEVGKWQGILREHADVPHRMIDLAAVRGLAETERLPLRDLARLPRIEIPKPDGQTRRQYGEALKIPGFSPAHFRGDGDMGGVHLYHLIDDPNVLYGLLLRGINTWGQWNALVEHSAMILTPDQQSTFDRAAAVHRALTALCRAWHVGRGKRVDRQALVDSNQVGSVFIDRVAALCDSLHGDAKLLIDSMENKGISGFRREKLAALKSYLEESGHLDSRPCLSPEEMRGRIVQAIFSDLDSGMLTLAQVDQMVAGYGETDESRGQPGESTATEPLPDASS